MKRIAAIVGRPNVGKSALFNRLAGGRIAIVHSQSGVTRDRLIRETRWRSQVFELVDTGGISQVGRERTHDEIEAGIRVQAQTALADASVAILVTDVDAGLTGLDQEVAGHLRQSGLPVVVAANKADTPAKDGCAAEFEGLGFPVFPVSALHNRGLAALMRQALAHLPAAENPTVRHPLNVVVAGRPNTGKSSYINRMVRAERLIVSDRPGTTRDSVDIPFTIGKGAQARHYRLVDTAGLRRESKIKQQVERFSYARAEQSLARADIVALMLDALDSPTAQDKKIAAMILEQQKGCLLLVNKWDLAQETQRQWGPKVQREMPFMGHCPIVFVSARTGYNIRRSLDAMDHVAAQIQTTLPTGLLNRVMLQLYEKNPMAVVRGKRPKIFYCTQVGHAPIRIRVFVNYPASVSTPYKAYLLNGLRRKFGLEGAFVFLEFRARERRTRPG